MLVHSKALACTRKQGRATALGESRASWSKVKILPLALTMRLQEASLSLFLFEESIHTQSAHTSSLATSSVHTSWVIVPTSTAVLTSRLEASSSGRGTEAGWCDSSNLFNTTWLKWSWFVWPKTCIAWPTTLGRCPGSWAPYTELFSLFWCCGRCWLPRWPISFFFIWKRNRIMWERSPGLTMCFDSTMLLLWDTRLSLSSSEPISSPADCTWHYVQVTVASRWGYGQEVTILLPAC